MTNPYFNFHEKSGTETDLYQNITDEIIQIYGVDFIFLPRKYQKKDLVLGEDVISYFDTNKPFTGFIENYELYNNHGDLFSKFGLEINDQIIISSHQSRFLTEVGEEPEDSDLIYYPIPKVLFEITNIEKELGFYQFGEQMMFKFNCKLYNYTGEEMTTGITEIDNLNSLNDVNTTEELDSIESDSVEIFNFDEGNIFGNL